MAFIAGIDEAGFGPVLGPLVVSATAFGLPDELADVSMWHLLAAAVARKPSRRRGGVVIGDSKKLYSRSRPKALEHLERAVLAVSAARGWRPASLSRLLGIVAPGAQKAVARYPWYARADLPLPLCITPTDVLLAGKALAAALVQAGAHLVAMRCETVFAGEFNRTVQATGNKSTTLFDVTCRLLAFLLRRLPEGPLRITIDRHGGRMRYLSALQRAFEGWQFKVLDETEKLSIYRLSDGSRTVELRFMVSAEQAQLPVALASMLSKYLRELFMELFNRFWAGHVPGLAPTAGYYADGRRFYADIAPAIRRLGVAESLLYRCR